MFDPTPEGRSVLFRNPVRRSGRVLGRASCSVVDGREGACVAADRRRGAIRGFDGLAGTRLSVLGRDRAGAPFLHMAPVRPRALAGAGL